MELGAPVFEQLRPLCVSLLELPALANSSSKASDANKKVLQPLMRLLDEVHLAGLEKCMDYVMFPLLLILDAAVASRSNAATNRTNQLIPGTINDNMVEGVLCCLETLLNRITLRDVHQMTMLLRKLTAAAMLSSEEASEEFRHGVVKCLKAMLLQLKPCDVLSCRCKVVSSKSISLEESANLNDDDDGTSKGCALAYLQAEDMSPAIGHLSSLLLKISYTEVSKGGLGSGKLRFDALSTIRTLILKVGSADALAFFLPGIASGLVKEIRSSFISNRCPSSIQFYSVGAAGSSMALVEAVETLGEFLLLVLGDIHNSHFYTKKEGNAMGYEKEGKDLSVVAMEKLQLLYAQKGTGASTLDQIDTTTASANCSSMKHFALENEDSQGGMKRKIANDELAPSNFRIERTVEWIEQTALRINTLLTETLPLLCGHPSPYVRHAVVETASMLLLGCGSTLENATPLFLECLLALSCDDTQDIASTASSYLRYMLFLGSTKSHKNAFSSLRFKQALLEVLRRLTEKLPKVLFTMDQTICVIQARKVAAAMYFAGPDGVLSFAFKSATSTSRFITIMMQCMSFNASLLGSMGELAVASTSSPIGIQKDKSEITRKSGSLDQCLVEVHLSGNVITAESLPRMPPWLRQAGARKTYEALSVILRLVGFSTMIGSNKEAIQNLVEPLLNRIRHTGSVDSKSNWKLKHGNEVEELWQINNRRSAATAACILNEILYGASGVWVEQLVQMFGNLIDIDQLNIKSEPLRATIHRLIPEGRFSDPIGITDWFHVRNNYEISCLVDCVSSILHDYIAAEIWDLSVDLRLPPNDEWQVEDRRPEREIEDNKTLQQVVVEGLGIFALALKKDFEEKGFLALVLYPLLEKLGSAVYDISSSADIALRAICSSCGYDSVQELVMANSDHFIDSLCRQLRHLVIYPHAPSMLATILQQTGIAPDLLPLLEEPMRGLLLELEIPGRYQHPSYTVPILKAVREITRASRHTAKHANAILQDKNFLVSDNSVHHLEEKIACQHSLVSISTSCLSACAPLLSSRDLLTCILALEIIEDGVAALATAQSVLNTAMGMLSDYKKQTINDDENSNEGNKDVNKLLPTMNDVWPHLVLCLRDSRAPVVIKCLHVITLVTRECGGDFFMRRFQKDALPLIIRLLHNGPYTTSTRSNLLIDSALSLMTSSSKRRGIEAESSPASVLNVQEAVLKCIQAISHNKSSASALELILKPIAACAVQFACNSGHLKNLASDTVMALSDLDGDLVWTLVADIVYADPETCYSMGIICNQPLGLPDLPMILPPLASAKHALWAQYAGQETDGNIEYGLAMELLKRLNHSNMDTL